MLSRLLKLFLLLLLVPLQVQPTLAVHEDYILVGKIGLYKPVQLVEDSHVSAQTSFYDLTMLGNGIGRLQYTSWGNVIDPGRTILVGHTPGAFEDIHNLDIGDQIILNMRGVEHIFNVFDTYVVDEDNDSIFLPAHQFEVVLITCIPENESKRLIIKAK